MRRLRWLVVLLALGLGLGSAHAAPTANVTATIHVTPGSYSISVAGTLALTGVSMDGTDKTTTGAASPIFTLADATGSDKGWNVVLSSTDFSDGTGTISANNFTFNPTTGVIAVVAGQAIDATNGPLETGGGGQSLAAPGFKVVQAQPGYGKGTYTYTPAAGKFSLVVPASTVVNSGDFTATMTATISQGP